MTNDVEIFFEDVPQQQNVLNVSTSVNESGDSELIVGLSAYQIAVNRGFVGTVEEWLLSLKGDKGDQGIQGDTGEQGIQGIQGDTGEQGIQGIQGIQGDTGEQGIQGIQGIQGDTGEQGIQGIQGIQGDTGEQGIQGIQGEQGIEGGIGFDGLSAYQIAVNNGFYGYDESQWLESLKGERGNDGADGIEGESAFQVAMRYGFYGDENEWLESLKGADGYDGMQGEQGIDGEQGIPGESAYQIAVNNGFYGYEYEWLESLRGDSAYRTAVVNGFNGNEVEWLESLIRGTTLAGYSQSSPSTVTTDDSIVSAIEKLQAQINSLGVGSGSSSVERKYPVNYWSNQLNTIVSTTGSYTATTVFMTYFSLPHTIKITRVHIPFTNAAANRMARLRLYKLNGNMATSVTETYNIPASTVDAVFDFVSELTIPSGEYFWAVQNTGTSGASNITRSIVVASTKPIPRASVVNNTSHNLVGINMLYANPLPDTVDLSVSTLSLTNVPVINMFVTG